MADEPASPRERIVAAQRRLGLGDQEVWSLYLGIGGSETFDAVQAYLSGAGALDERDERFLSVALHDELLERGEGTA